MKFSDYTIKKKSPNGTVFVTDSIIVVQTEQPCMVCGRLTKYLDICSEQHFCSDDCETVFNNLVARQEGK